MHAPGQQSMHNGFLIPIQIAPYFMSNVKCQMLQEQPVQEATTPTVSTQKTSNSPFPTKQARAVHSCTQFSI